jgi:hypothetical protein
MIQGFSGGLLRNTELFYLLDLPTFQRDFAQFKTLNHATGPAITFTRASGATFFDADGVLQTAANDTPRFDHSGGNSLGLLIEEQRTNSIRNSQAGGAVVGTPGTLPTSGWEVSMPTGLSRQVVATGTQAGFNYIDLRISGTRSGGGTSALTIRQETTTQVVVSTGQVWTGSLYVALIAGSFTQVGNPRFTLVERLAGGTAITTYETSIAAATSSLQRYTVSETMADASAARANIQIQGTVSDGNTVDFTLRIAAPQLEQGAFATSYIPTTSAAATRAADSAIVTPVSSFYNQSEGTLFTAFRPRTVSGTRTLSAFDNDTEDEQVRLRNVDTDPRLTVNDGGVEQANIDAGTVAAATDYRLAAAFKLDDFAASLNGASAVTDTSGTMPTITHLRIGNSKAGNVYNGAIARIAYWPKRLSNTLLEQLTT